MPARARSDQAQPVMLSAPLLTAAGAVQVMGGARWRALGSALPRAHDQSGGPGRLCQFVSGTKSELGVRFDVGRK